MKRLFLLILALGLLSGLKAQSAIGIYGTVSNLNGGAPISGHTVYIFADSTNTAGFQYSSTLLTSGSGFYIDTIAIPSNVAIDFYVSVQDCQNMWHTNTVTANSNGTVNGLPADFSICGTSTPNCQSSFLARPDSTGFTWLFAGTSNTNVTSWSWNFGDGSTGTGQNVSHSYNVTGTFVVCLTTVDANQCSFTYCDTVNVGTPPGGGCQSSFTAYNDTAQGARTWVFTDQSTGTPSIWAWDFGDGNFSSAQNPTHTYAANGNYTVILTIIDSLTNCFSTSTQRITVGSSTPNCSVSFQAFPDTTQANTLYFSGIPANTNGPITWSWNFGDGNTSNVQYPTHTYANSGWYVVCVSIVSGNCQASYCDTVQAGSIVIPCQAQFGYSTNGLTANFIDRSYPNITSWSWDFGDGNSSTMQNPTHTYSQYGTYTACLVITTSNGCVDTTCSTLTISQPTYNLFGQVWTGNNYADHGTAWLITFDSTSNLLTAVDSMSIDSSGLYYFWNIPAGTYTVKAALDSGSAVYANYLPTYLGDSLFWHAATFVDVTQINGPQDIHLVAGNNPGGPGFIGGNVQQGANKRDPGDPIEGVAVLLLNMNNEAIAYTYTDANGDFGFSNLDYGTYKVYSEVLNKETIPAIVTLDQANSSVNNIIIEINSDQVSTTALDPNQFDYFEGVTAYPNPAGAETWLKLDLKQSSEVRISIRNAMGQVMYQQQQRLGQGSNELKLDLSELSSGVYFLQLEAEKQEQTAIKLIKY